MTSHAGQDSTAFGDRIMNRGTDAYAIRHADDSRDVVAAQRLRFEVFNLELREGLNESFATGLDQDPFDEICDHLLVEDSATGLLVGTYRLQTGPTAAARRGYYGEQEFDFTPFEPARAQIIELGRACVHSQHRNLAVLSLLWKGIAAYAKERGARYLIGCSSLTSQEPREGAAMYQHLAVSYLADHAWRTQPQPTHRCQLEDVVVPAPRVPKLLAAYLTIGARICGPPAIDREFKTIDFLTFLDIQALPQSIIQKYLT